MKKESKESVDIDRSFTMIKDLNLYHLRLIVTQMIS